MFPAWPRVRGDGGFCYCPRPPPPLPQTLVPPVAQTLWDPLFPTIASAHACCSLPGRAPTPRHTRVHTLAHTPSCRLSSRSRSLPFQSGFPAQRSRVSAAPYRPGCVGPLWFGFCSCCPGCPRSLADGSPGWWLPWLLAGGSLAAGSPLFLHLSSCPLAIPLPLLLLLRSWPTCLPPVSLSWTPGVSPGSLSCHWTPSPWQSPSLLGLMTSLPSHRWQRRVPTDHPAMEELLDTASLHVQRSSPLPVSPQLG